MIDPASATPPPLPVPQARHGRTWLDTWFWRLVLVFLALCGPWVAHETWRDEDVLAERGVRAALRVTDVDCQVRGGFVRVEIDGVERTADGCPDPDPRVGDVVEVLYDPQDPERLRLSGRSDRPLAVFTASVGLVSLTTLGVLTHRGVRRRRATVTD